VDLAVDRDGGLFFEVVAEPRVELVHLADHAAQVFGLDLKLAHAAGIAPAEAGGDVTRAVILQLLSLRRNPHPPRPPP